MGTAAAAPRCVLPAQAELGESPTWSALEQCLYWLDIGSSWPAAGASVLHRFDPSSGATRRWDLPQTAGSFALEPDGRVLLALVGGLCRLDLRTGQLDARAAAPYDPRTQRFNDGRVDPTGRFFWVGTCRAPDAGEAGLGGLYRWDGRTLERMLDGVSIANGLAWSPDGRTLYFCDSAQHKVWAFDYDLDEGRIANRRVFTRLEGVSFDGAAVDAEGGYWTALYNSGKVLRLRPDGTLDREIGMPVSKPTMPAFGGPGLSTLFVTSARHRLEPQEQAAQPLAGGVFAFEPGVAGLQEPMLGTARPLAR